MAKKGFFHIDTEGMGGMERDFERLTTPEPFQVGRERLDNALEIGFEATQAATPEDDGDYRRPPQSLRNSGRYSSSFDGDFWNAEIAYGYNGPDPAVNYALYVQKTNLRKRGTDFVNDPLDALTPLFDEAVNAPFDDVFHVEH